MDESYPNMQFRRQMWAMHFDPPPPRGADEVRVDQDTRLIAGVRYVNAGPLVSADGYVYGARYRAEVRLCPGPDQMSAHRYLWNWLCCCCRY